MINSLVKVYFFWNILAEAWTKWAALLDSNILAYFQWCNCIIEATEAQNDVL